MAKKHKGSAATVIAVLIVFSILVIIVTIIYPDLQAAADKMRLIQIPTVSTMVRSESDGKAHNVVGKFSVAINPKAEKNVNAKTMQERIVKAMSKMDYDLLDGPDSDAYIKEMITKELGTYVKPEDLLGVYMTEFQSGDLKVPLDEEPQDRTTRSERMRGLFQNMN